MHFLYPWTHNPDHVLWSFSRQDAYHLLDYPIPLGRPWIPLFSHYNLPLTRLFGLGLLDLTWPGPCGPEFLLPFACRLFTFHMTKSTDIVVGNFLVTFCFFCSRFFRILNNKYSARSTFSSRVCRLSLHVALEWMPKSWGLQLVILWHLRGLSIMESKGCKQADAFSWQPGGFYLFIA